MKTPAIEIKDLACTYVSEDGKNEEHYTAVKDVNLNIAEGEFVSIVGPTGCGKSTILNMTAGLLQPSHGTIRIFGEPLIGLNRRAGYMFQAENLMPWRNALDNVIAGLEFKGVPKSEAEKSGKQNCKGGKEHHSADGKDGQGYGQRHGQNRTNRR